MKRRGGVGHDLSHIRAKGSTVKNSALTSTGVVPFMERYSNSTREVAQDGRRGALMLSISTDHEDSLDFADAKLEDDKITGANISLKASDRFMHNVLVAPYEGKMVPWKQFKKDNELWRKVIHNSWKKAEPAFLFWDTILKESIPSCYGATWEEKSTNPCGELPLPPYDSCRLIAINLYSYVDDPFTPTATFDFEKFASHVKKAQRLADDLVDLELEKIDKILLKIETDPESLGVKAVERELWEKIKRMARDGRRTGLGVTGVGDMIAALGLRYGDEGANNFIESVMERFKVSAYYSSTVMAAERGTFPIFNEELEKDNPFLNRANIAKPRRNIALLTIAPTGSVSLLAGVTSGIEPVFRVAYKRRKKINPNENDTPDFIDQNGDAWKEYNVVHHKFIDWFIEHWEKLPDATRLSRRHAERALSGMSEDEINKYIKISPYHNATANDIDWVSKVKMQGMVQKHIDHSISVTVNIPKEATEETVEAIYREAYLAGCKGVTVYRDGSRSGVLVTEESDEKKIEDSHAPRRPKTLKADVIQFQNNHEKWVAFIGLYHGRPYEIFAGKLHDELVEFTKTKKDVKIIKEKSDEGSKYFAVFNGTKIEVSSVFNQEYWNYAKLISGLLRHGMPLQYVYDIIKGMNWNDDHLNSWKNGVARIIKRYISDGVKSKAECPDCGGKLEFQEGCESCSCGHSKCG
jgi:ribonucleoside-diphosphate reductase alpha chain